MKIFKIDYGTICICNFGFQSTLDRLEGKKINELMPLKAKKTC